MNSDKIERSAVRALETLVDKYPKLSAQISKNDRYPLWDGDIFVYNSSEHTNQSLKGRIPIQVKGQKLKSRCFSESAKGYRVAVDNLRAYCKDGGVIFFVIEVSADETIEVSADETSRIFYKTLLPVDIKCLLKEKDRQKTITIKMAGLIENKHKNLQLICDDFLIHRKKQYGLETIIQPIAIEKIQGGSLFLPTENIDYLLYNETFIYFNSTDFSPPMVEKGQVSVIGTDLPWEVKISKTYFSKIHLEYIKNGFKIIFGSRIELNFRDDHQESQIPPSFKINISGSLNEALETAYFMIDLFKSKCFSIDGRQIGITDFKGKEEHLISFTRELEIISTVLDRLRLPLDIDLEKINAQKNLLLALSDPIVYKKDYIDKIFRSTNTESNVGMHYTKICDHWCYFLEIFRGKDNYMLYDCFTSSFTELLRWGFRLNDELSGKTTFLDSPFMAYSKFEYKDLKLIATEQTNFNKSVLIAAIEQSEMHPAVAPHMTRFLLDLLRVYDEDFYEDFYTIADFLSLKLFNGQKEASSAINRMQVIKRKRNLSHNEESELIALMETEQSAHILCAIHILLENSFEIRKYFNQLKDDTKQQFICFPIYNLYKRSIETSCSE